MLKEGSAKSERVREVEREILCDSRVSTVAVGDVLRKERSVAVSAPLLGELGRLVGGENVHRVDLDTSDNVATLVVLGVHRGAGSRGTHAVLVVLADEDAGEVPELSLWQ